MKHESDDLILALAWFETFYQDTKEATITIPVYGRERGNQEYILQLWDEGGDGICCDWGNGSYELYVGDATTDGQSLLRSGGDYGKGEAVRVVIEEDAPPTTFPSQQPSKSPTSYPSKSPTQPPSTVPTPLAKSTRIPTYAPVLLTLPLGLIPASRIPQRPPSTLEEQQLNSTSSSTTASDPTSPPTYSPAYKKLNEPVMDASNKSENAVASANASSAANIMWRQGSLRCCALHLVAVVSISAWALLF